MPLCLDRIIGTGSAMKNNFARILFAIFLLSSTLASAQTFTATLTGTVSDPNGAVIPGVTVTITNARTGVAKRVLTDDSGRYVAPLLQPSTYSVTAELTGFKKAIAENIRLEVNQTAEINLQLSIGEIAQTVEVSSSVTPLLMTEQSSVDQSIEQKFIEDLPLADQDIFQIVHLVPGVI